MVDEKLHDAGTSSPMFQPHNLYSLLDIMCGGSAPCDSCGRWQRFSAFGVCAAEEYLSKFGWTFLDGKDICPKCSRDAIQA